MNLLKDPRRLRLAIIILVVASGLAVVLLETLVKASIPRNIQLALRTVFWASAICYLWLRLSKKIC